MRLFYGTNFVTEDEDCLSLEESNHPTPDSKGLHRFQIIWVHRQDKPIQYRMDMGDAVYFSDDGFYILGGGIENGRFASESSVGELRGIADYMRAHKVFDKWGFSKMEPNKPIQIPDRRRN